LTRVAPESNLTTSVATETAIAIATATGRPSNAVTVAIRCGQWQHQMRVWADHKNNKQTSNATAKLNTKLTPNRTNVSKEGRKVGKR